MPDKNKKIIIAGLIAIIVIVVILLATAFVSNKNKQNFEGLGEVRKAASLDDYIEADSELLHKKNAEAFQLPKKEVVPPVPTQMKIEKITMAPIMLGGGDAIYAMVAELPGNNFFRLEPDNLNKVFFVNSPEEALKYVDFLMVTAGKSSYDRIRQTVWQTSDYDKIGCKVMSDEANKSLPTDRPVSQAKISSNGFEVNWIYFTPAFPAGYHKMVVQIEKDGSFSVKDNPQEPFWPCGEGILF